LQLLSHGTNLFPVITDAHVLMANRIGDTSMFA
jgi:hypothetical protein